MKPKKTKKGAKTITTADKVQSNFHTASTSFAWSNVIYFFRLHC